MLKVKNACKTFLAGTVNEHKALCGVDLHLKPGDFYTVIGTNGSGKSTLFNSIAGNFLLDDGEIILDDVDITYMKEHKRAKMIGRMFQDPMKGTAPDMTIEENLTLAYSRSHKGLFSKAIRKKDSDTFREILAQLDMGLENRMKTKMKLLSGGQRQSVTLMMSTIAKPKLLLLDEHTAALDPVSAEKVLKLTNEIVGRDKITTLMITHNITSALRLGTHTIMLDRGNIILELSGAERDGLTVQGLMDIYYKKSEKVFDTDSMLL